MIFREVIGHGRILERLRRAMASGRVAHAYLFVGPRGVGKATVARAFAAALICPGEPGEGCGDCPSCRRVASASHPDFHLVEPSGQEVKIEQVRALQEALSYRPSTAPRQVAVLPEAERLNVNAANALLKTLEEPPGRTVVVLVSPSASLLPPTVVSRCERVAFSPLPTGELAELLVARRGLNKDAAALVAAISAGRLGLALEADLGELKASRERALEFLRAACKSPASILEWAQAWSDEQRRAAGGVRASGIELASVLLSLARDMVLVAAGQRDKLVHPDLAELYGALPLSRSPRRAAEAFEAVTTAQAQLARNLNPQLVFEATGLAIAEAGRGRHIEGSL